MTVIIFADRRNLYRLKCITEKKKNSWGLGNEHLCVHNGVKILWLVSAKDF